MISIRDLSITYRPSSPEPALALRHVSLDVASGAYLLITGPSGCGKSTLALALAGIIPQHVPAQVDGQILVDSRSVSQSAGVVGIVFQTPGVQLFQDTVADELAFGPRNLGWPDHQVQTQIRQTAQTLGITPLLNRPVRELSGGEQQLVAIAAVLSMDPPVLVLDEPLASLDHLGAAAVLDALDRIHSQGRTILLIEHRLDAVYDRVPRAALMDGGRVVANGPTAAVLDTPRLQAMGLRYPRPLGQSCLATQADSPIAEPILSLEGVDAGYGRELVLRRAEMRLYPGETVALVGDNGAGKTTLARLLTGLLKPRRGRLRWSRSLRRLPWPLRVGLLYQQAHHQVLCDTVQAEIAYGPTNMGREQPDWQETLLRRADLWSVRHRSPQALSVGQLERCTLAATMALKPRLLILDEPTLGQDWRHLCAMMDSLTGQLGDQTVLLITHDEKLVCRYATRLLRLERGALESR